MKSFLYRPIIVARVGLLLLILSLVGCSSVPQKTEGEIAPQRTVEEYAPDDQVYAIDQYDPWEGFNRTMYRFNAWFDRSIFLPVTGAYDYVMPELVKDGVHNFMRNVGDIENLINSLLQLKFENTAETASRLAWNTTVGVLGVMDPATSMGLNRHDEDFGQTLGHYGVGPGPYLVLPIFGPSNLRDTTGLLVDSYMFSEIDPLKFDDNNDSWEYSYYGLKAVDTRNNIGFRYYETGSPFEYELLRLMYLKMRELEIAK